MKAGTVVIENGKFIYEEETHLTAMKTSLFFPGDGFPVYDSNGELVFRVDSYGPNNHEKDELILMDASGRCLLTVRRKWPSLHQRWEGFLGERSDGQKHIFSVRRSSMIGRCSMTIETDSETSEEYHIEGSFAQRNCTIYDSDRKAMAEIKRKVDVEAHVVIGKDTFLLSVKAGYDVAFAMALVLMLDQINGGDDDDVDECVKNGGLAKEELNREATGGQIAT